MRKIIVSTYMTLNGVIDNPVWTFPYWGDDIADFQTADLFASDALLLGRETYEGFKSAWPARAGADAFADRINSLPKYVVSRTLESAEWNSTVLGEDIVAELTALKAQEGQNILKYGGGELLATLLDNDLLDEIHVLLYPVMVGEGARLIPDGREGKLQLAEVKQFSSGVVGLIYHAVKEEAAPAE
jgi:dihydrofolate reductase